MANFKTTILIAFCLSNVSVLMYQVIWGRQLGYIFGTTMYAVSTVLAGFMAGLAMGSYYFGKLVDRYKNPVKLFSYLEIAIGISGLAMTGIFKILSFIYPFLYGVFSWNQQVFIISLFSLTFIILVIPTTLMGGTFPVISKIYNNELKGIGKDISVVYSADTLGACIGVLLGGFVLLPLVGLRETTTVAALINLILGIFILRRPANAFRSEKSVQERKKNVKS